MISIVEDLDTISQMESGELSLYFEKFDIVALVNELFLGLEMKASGRNIRLKFSENYNRPIYVSADKHHIRQVVTNLIVNSIKYGKQDGISQVRFTDLYQHVVIEISDNGMGIPKENILSTLLKMPDVVSSSSEVLTEEEWKQIQDLLHEAIKALIQHRLEEGKSVEKDLLERVVAIEAHQADIEKFEPNRRVKIKEGLVKLLEQHVGPDKYDNNRLEQELIYYIEKIDISEEKVRLNNHCTYFKTVLKEAEASKGKKLSFILQEMGREINTTGSKANDMEMQKSVILMKDELEKAKEQILNVL
jgi:uncharacterized protein (TIGR00255 family)